MNGTINAAMFQAAATSVMRGMNHSSFHGNSKHESDFTQTLMQVSQQFEQTGSVEKMPEGTFHQQEMEQLTQLLLHLKQAAEQGNSEQLHTLLGELESLLEELADGFIVQDQMDLSADQLLNRVARGENFPDLMSFIHAMHQIQMNDELEVQLGRTNWDQLYGDRFVQGLSQAAEQDPKLMAKAENILAGLERLLVKIEQVYNQDQSSKTVQQQKSQLLLLQDIFKTIVKGHKEFSNLNNRASREHGQTVQHGLPLSLKDFIRSRSSTATASSGLMKQTVQTNQQTQTVQTNMFGQLDSNPISKLEQYTIYLQNQKSDVQGQSQTQLMDQIRQIIQSSRFLKRDGLTQMTIKLKPAHLGEMMIQLTQINGEMAVKMTVTSQAVKEMLEGNLNQLRHMFSPNQVVIEKQSEHVPQQVLYSFRDDQQSKDHDRENNQQDSDREEQQSSEEQNSFHEIFSQIEQVIT